MKSIDGNEYIDKQHQFINNNDKTLNCSKWRLSLCSKLCVCNYHCLVYCTGCTPYHLCRQVKFYHRPNEVESLSLGNRSIRQQTEWFCRTSQNLEMILVTLGTNGAYPCFPLPDNGVPLSHVPSDKRTVLSIFLKIIQHRGVQFQLFCRLRKSDYIKSFCSRERERETNLILKNIYHIQCIQIDRPTPK